MRFRKIAAMIGVVAGAAPASASAAYMHQDTARAAWKGSNGDCETCEIKAGWPSDYYTAFTGQYFRADNDNRYSEWTALKSGTGALVSYYCLTAYYSGGSVFDKVDYSGAYCH